MKNIGYAIALVYLGFWLGKKKYITDEKVSALVSENDILFKQIQDVLKS